MLRFVFAVHMLACLCVHAVAEDESTSSGSSAEQIYSLFAPLLVAKQQLKSCEIDGIEVLIEQKGIEPPKISESWQLKILDSSDATDPGLFVRVRRDEVNEEGIPGGGALLSLGRVPYRVKVFQFRLEQPYGNQGVVGRFVRNYDVFALPCLVTMQLRPRQSGVPKLDLALAAWRNKKLVNTSVNAKGDKLLRLQHERSDSTSFVFTFAKDKQFLPVQVKSIENRSQGSVNMETVNIDWEQVGNEKLWVPVSVDMEYLYPYPKQRKDKYKRQLLIDLEWKRVNGEITHDHVMRAYADAG